MGMQSDPTNEIIRLQNFIEKNPNMDKETQARVKNMLTSQHNILNRVRAFKAKRLPGPFDENEAKTYSNFITDQIVNKFGIPSKRNDFTGAYVTIGDKNDKNTLVTNYVNKLMNTLNDAAKKGILSKQGNFMTIVSEAIYGNKKLIEVNGLLDTADDEVIFDQDDVKKLQTKGSQLNKPGKKNLSGMSQSQLVAKIKSMQSNTPDRTKAMDQLVKLIISNRKAQGTPISYNDAMNIAKNLIK